MPRLKSRHIRPSNVFGDMAVISNGLREATVVADTDVVVYALPATMVNSLNAGQWNTYLRKVFLEHSSQNLNGVPYMTSEDFVNGVQISLGLESMTEDAPATTQEPRKEGMAGRIPFLRKSKERSNERKRVIQEMLTLIDRDSSHLISFQEFVQFDTLISSQGSEVIYISCVARERVGFLIST